MESSGEHDTHARAHTHNHRQSITDRKTIAGTDSSRDVSAQSSRIGSKKKNSGARNGKRLPAPTNRLLNHHAIAHFVKIYGIHQSNWSDFSDRFSGGGTPAHATSCTNRAFPLRIVRGRNVTIITTYSDSFPIGQRVGLSCGVTSNHLGSRVVSIHERHISSLEFNFSAHAEYPWYAPTVSRGSPQ